ncbi:hypothetical protein [Chryseobacterium sp. 3008163]|nr:hypothetical protein [Chryseobacterium sp. 3008163]
MTDLQSNADRPMGRFDVNVKFNQKGEIIKATNNVTKENLKIDKYNK